MNITNIDITDDINTVVIAADCNSSIRKAADANADADASDDVREICQK